MFTTLGKYPLDVIDTLHVILTPLAQKCGNVITFKTYNEIFGVVQIKTLDSLSQFSNLKEFKLEVELGDFDIDLVDERLTSLIIMSHNLPVLPDLSRFRNLNMLNISGNKDIIISSFPPTITRLVCVYNNLKKLPPLPVNLTYLDCSDNELTYLPELPLKLQTLLCSGNRISQLPLLPDELWHLECHKNKLTKLPPLSASSLIEMNCSNNRLCNLPMFNPQLWRVSCVKNKLTSIRPFSGVVHFSGNPVYKIMTNEMAVGSNLYKIKILDQFRTTYSGIKLSVVMRKWLYTKIIEPKMKLKYHPDRLIELLSEIDEDDEDELNRRLDLW